MADWGGLYLRQDLGASAARGRARVRRSSPAGMTVGRVVGDWVNRRIGAGRAAALGRAADRDPARAMLLIGTPAAALAGLFSIGLGVANGVPLMFSAAGRQPDTPPGPGIAAVSSMGSLGFLAGPPFIGVLADAVSLPWALATLILGAVVVFALARRAGRRPPRRAGRAASRCRCRELRRRHLRPRRRARRLDRRRPCAAGRAWGERHGLDGAAIQAGNHGRPARAVIAEHVAAGAARRGGGAASPTPRRPTPTASSRMPGAADVLALPRVAIATSCTAPLARARLARRRACRSPRVLVTSDQVENGKPAPDPYLLAAERLGVDPAGVPRVRGRAGRHRRRPRRGHDRVGGHDDARAGARWARRSAWPAGCRSTSRRCGWRRAVTERQRRWVGNVEGARWLETARTVATCPRTARTHPTQPQSTSPLGQRESSGRRSNDPPSTQCSERYWSGRSG